MNRGRGRGGFNQQQGYNQGGYNRGGYGQGGRYRGGYQNGNGGQYGPVICSVCGGRGHTERFCDRYDVIEEMKRLVIEMNFNVGDIQKLRELWIKYWGDKEREDALKKKVEELESWKMLMPMLLGMQQPNPQRNPPLIDPEEKPKPKRGRPKKKEVKKRRKGRREEEDDDEEMSEEESDHEDEDSDSGKEKENDSSEANTTVSKQEAVELAGMLKATGDQIEALEKLKSWVRKQRKPYQALQDLADIFGVANIGTEKRPHYAELRDKMYCF